MKPCQLTNTADCQTAEVKTDELTPPTPIYEEIEDIHLAVDAYKEEAFDMLECDAYTVAITQL